MNNEISNNFRFLKIQKFDSNLDWNNFKFAGDVDYVSFFMQYHIGIITVGTVAWIMQQTIEKYCKAILNKSDSLKYPEGILAKKPYSHDLINLWSEIKKETKQFSYEKAYEDLIYEIDKVTTHTRYVNSAYTFKQGLIETFTVLGCEFRFELMGKMEFNKSFFGLLPDLITPLFYLNNYCFDDLFKKLMHISIEHGISFSISGIPDPYEHTNVELSIATSKFCQCGLHKEIEKDCPMCNKKFWQNGRRENNDSIILSEYFTIKK